MIDYYLYCNNIAGIRKHLDSFLSDPAESIDIFIPVFDKLVYYGHSDLVLDISLHMFEKVKDAPGLIAGSESGFGWTIYLEKLQSIYSDLKKDIPVNRDASLEYLAKIGYKLESDMDMIMEVLSPGTHGRAAGSACDQLRYERIPDFTDYRKNKGDFSYNLMLLFCRYMLETKNVNFSVSGDIWDVALNSFKAGSPGNSPDTNFDNVFELDKDKYDEEISGRMGFISNKYICGFMVAWGIVYVYDFLYKHGYISDKVYNNALEVIDGIKVEIIKGYANSLWEYEIEILADFIAKKHIDGIMEVLEVGVALKLTEEQLKRLDNIIERAGRKQKYMEEKEIEIARKMLKIGDNIEKVQMVTNLSFEKIQQLVKEV